MRRSSAVSEFITHRRRMSAPYCFITSWGAVTLPRDFDILRPCSSSTKPCVSTALKGATPFVPTDSSSEEWNQPRCWSDPSRYKSAGKGRPRGGRTKACVEPDSNQTSTMSMTCSNCAGSRPSPRKRAAAPGLYQASAPSVRKASTTRSMMAGSRSGSPVARSTNTGIGTPQARWREMHQSGRAAIMESRRLRPASGTKCVRAIASRAFSRMALPSSIAMNHCGVARKITGFFDRQECG